MGRLLDNFIIGVGRRTGSTLKSIPTVEDLTDPMFNAVLTNAMSNTINTTVEHAQGNAILPLSHDVGATLNEDGSFDWNDNPDDTTSNNNSGHQSHKPEAGHGSNNGQQAHTPSSLLDPDDFKAHLGVDGKNGPSGVILDVYKPVEINSATVEVVGLLTKNGDFYSYDDVMQAAAKQSFIENFSKVDLPDEIKDELFSTEFESTDAGVDYTNYDAFTNDMSGASHIGGFNAGLGDFWIDRYDRLYPGFKDAYNDTCSELVLCDNYLHQTADERAAAPRVVKSDIVELLSDSVNDLSRGNDYAIGAGHDHSDINPVIIDEFNPVTAGVSSAIEGITTGRYIGSDGKFNSLGLTCDIIAGATFGAILSTSDVDVNDKKELLNTMIQNQDLMKTVLNNVSDPNIMRGVSEAINSYGLKPYLNDIQDNLMNPQAVMDIVRDPGFLESLSETVDHICELPMVENNISVHCKDSDLRKSVDDVVNDFSRAESLINEGDSISDKNTANHDAGSNIKETNTYMSPDIEVKENNAFFGPDSEAVLYEL